MTTAQEHLASSTARAIGQRLDTGTIYIRVPEITTPLPVTEILTRLARTHPELRVAVFLNNTVTAPASMRLTQVVHEAIEWRDDPDDQTPLLIFGNLQRNRAAGLSSVRALPSNMIRSILCERLVETAKDQTMPHALTDLLMSLHADLLNDLGGLADYGAALLNAPAQMHQVAKADLWRLSMLPDTKSASLTSADLAENRRLVGDIRAGDAKTLTGLAGSLEPAEYAVLRQYAQRPQHREYLRGLEFRTVLGAFTKAKTKPGTTKKTGQGNGTGVASVLDLVNDPRFDEGAFLEQISDDKSELAESDTVRIAGAKEAWDKVPIGEFGKWLAAAGPEGYGEAAGGVIDLDAAALRASDEATTEWVNLREIRNQLRKLESISKSDAQPSTICDELIALRVILLPHIRSIPREGVRLFYYSATLMKAADDLVATWLALWQAVAELRDGLDVADREYVEQVANSLIQADTHIETSVGQGVTAHLLPLHPIVIEPRVVAARVLRETTTPIDDEFVELLSTSADPGMPGLAVNVNGAKRALSYAGTKNQLPYYQAVPRSAEGTELGRSLQTLTERFINVHPFTYYNLAVVLVGPAASLVRQYVRWLSTAVPDRIEVDVFARAQDTEEMRGAVDAARADLTAREIDPDKVVIRLNTDTSLATLPARLQQGNINPHMILAFDLADSAPNKFTSNLAMPLKASIITQWSFSVNPLETRPVIRTQSGSGRLVDVGNLQLDLTSLGPPSQERSPLLSAKTSKSISEMSEIATWVAVTEAGSALAAPAQIGSAHLIGRSTSSAHQTYVYSKHLPMLLEPVLTLLQNHTWIHPDSDDLARFLLSTVRLATPEGLLGFYKTRGRLSPEAVLGHLGVAAVLGYLEQNTPGDHLVISLDTEAARQWLNLRGDARRADLLVVSWDSADQPTVTAVEVKTRREAVSWSGAEPPVVVEALDQVTKMRSLFAAIFSGEGEDALTPARREILKRQVFLDALHQWENTRTSDSAMYHSNIDRLNLLFGSEVAAKIASTIFVVSTEESSSVATRKASDGSTEIITLGVHWLQDALAAHEGGLVDIPAELLDTFGAMLDAPPEDSGSDAPAGGPATVLMSSLVAETQDVTSANGASTAAAPGSEVKASASTEPTASPQPLDSADSDVDLPALGVALRQVLVARKAALRSIDIDKATVGPSVIQIPFKLSQGARLATLQSQEGDISRELGVSGSRIFNWPKEPGYAAIELPRPNRVISDVSTVAAPADGPGTISIALGAGIDFSPYYCPLGSMPHLLVAGTTGSGKSVFLRSLLWQLTHQHEAEELEIVVIDAKGMADYVDFSHAPHMSDFHLGVAGAMELLADIVDNRLPARVAAFNSYADEALERGERIADVQHLIADAAKRGVAPPLKTLVVLIDEFAELVLATSDRRRFESLVTRFNQMARAIGGHLIAATQRPSADIVTGVMKSNFARLALRVQSAVDSRVILDEGGAELLQGKGDLLFRSPERGTVRLQGYNAPGPYRFKRVV